MELESTADSRILWTLLEACLNPELPKPIQISTKQDSSLLSDAPLFIHRRARLSEMDYRAGLCANSTHQAHSQWARQWGACVLRCLCWGGRWWLGKEERNERTRTGFCRHVSFALVDHGVTDAFLPWGWILQSLCSVLSVVHSQWPPSSGLQIYVKFTFTKVIGDAKEMSWVLIPLKRGQEKHLPWLWCLL